MLREASNWPRNRPKPQDVYFLEKGVFKYNHVKCRKTEHIVISSYSICTAAFFFIWIYFSTESWFRTNGSWLGLVRPVSGFAWSDSELVLTQNMLSLIYWSWLGLVGISLGLAGSDSDLLDLIIDFSVLILTALSWLWTYWTWLGNFLVLTRGFVDLTLALTQNLFELTLDLLLPTWDFLALNLDLLVPKQDLLVLTWTHWTWLQTSVVFHFAQPPVNLSNINSEVFRNSSVGPAGLCWFQLLVIKPENLFQV